LRIAAFALTLLAASAAPALTIDFDNIPGLTPIPFVQKAEVPTSARLKSLDLPGGGRITFDTYKGSSYVALVTLDNRVGIVAVTDKGKIKQGALVDLRIKDAPDLSIESFVIAGAFKPENAPATDPFTGTAVWVANSKKQRYPPSGGSYGLAVSGTGELSMLTLQDQIFRLRVGNGTVFLDSLLIAGAAPAGVTALSADVPEPGALALLALALGALALRRR
jgi:hypothetical protein